MLKKTVPLLLATLLILTATACTGKQQTPATSYSEAATEPTCTHDFTVTDIEESTCVTLGYRHLVCSKCGYTKYAHISRVPHTYQNRVCTVCNNEAPVERSTIEANTYYEYLGELPYRLMYQNCQIISAKMVYSPGDNPDTYIAVVYYLIYPQCHVVNVTPTERWVHISSDNQWHPLGCDYCGIEWAGAIFTVR